MLQRGAGSIDRLIALLACVLSGWRVVDPMDWSVAALKLINQPIERRGWIEIGAGSGRSSAMRRVRA